MATCLGFNLVALEGEKLSISINDLENFDCEIYRTYGVFLTELPAGAPGLKEKMPPFEEEMGNFYEEGLQSFVEWTKHTSAKNQSEYIICRAPSAKLAGITSFPTGARLQIKTPYEADLIINAQIDSVLLRKAFKAKGSEALIWISWKSKEVSWTTEDGKPPKAALKKKL